MEPLRPADREKVRAYCDKYGSSIALARRWGIDAITLGRAALGHAVNRGTRALVERGLESEAK